jgi:DHA2 family multidrug resistance protein-like MFS transporter
MVIGFAITSLGSGPLVTLGTNLVVGSALPEKAGSAAALVETSNESGYALGVAILGSMGTAVYRIQIASTLPASVPPAAVDATGESLTGAAAAAQTLPNQIAVVLLNAAREAFTSGLHIIAALSALLLAGIAILVVTMLRHVRPVGEAETPAPELSRAEVT